MARDQNNKKGIRFRKPSTRAFRREGKRLEDYSFFDWLHGYLYSRWPYFYIRVGIGEHNLSRFFVPLWNLITKIFQINSADKDDPERVTFADSYHGKVVAPGEARQLVSVKQDIDLRNLDKIIPYKKARDIVLQNPESIVVLDCPCRMARPNPCLPLDVCLVIGEPFASFTIEHHPGHSRRITSEEAVNIIEEEHARGHVQHAFFKDAMLNRFYAICNCCSCCCGAMQAWRNGVPMLESSGYVARVNPEDCELCGQCAEICPFGVIKMTDETVLIDETTCMGCGICVSHCPQNALTLARDSRKSEPLIIEKLIQDEITK